MKKFIIAAAAVGALGLSAAGANAQMMVEQYSAPAPGTVVVEGRNTTIVPSGNTASRYIPDAYVDGNWNAMNPYQRAPGVEPYIAKQIEQDQKGDGN